MLGKFKPGYGFSGELRVRYNMTVAFIRVGMGRVNGREMVGLDQDRYGKAE